MPMSYNVKRIRVLHVLGALNIGGAESMVMNLYRSINRNNVQFDFVIHTEEKCDYTEEILELGGKIYSCPRYRGKNHFVYCNWWKEFFKTHSEYHIIHGHVRSTATLYLREAKKYGCLTISHSHSTSNGSGLTSLVKKVLQYPIRNIADYMFACSDESGKWLFGKNALKKNTYHFLPNAIDISKYKYNETIRESIRKAYNVDKKVVLGTVGRIIEAKNPFGLLEIFEEAYHKDDNLILMWVGTGKLEEKVKKEAEKRGLSNAIIFMGNRNDVPSLMQAFDIFLFPSLWEGLPVTVVEAQAAGLPCLVSTNVTRQVGISKLVRYLPITESVNKWVDEILGMPIERLDVSLKIKEAGFDIKETSRWLESFYCSL